MRIHKLMLTGLAVLLGALAVEVAPAGAAIGYTDLCPSLETAFCTFGTIVEPRGVAVDNSGGASAGDVWVLTGIERVESKRLVKFDASGTKLLEINEGSIAGATHPVFSAGTGVDGVAVSPVDGAVDVVSDEAQEEGMGVVSVFNSSGALQLQFTGSEAPQGSFHAVGTGIAVDSHGNIYVSDYHYNGNRTQEMIDEFTASGKYVTQAPVPIATGTYPNSLAVDPQGNLYVGTVPNGSLVLRDRILEYDSAGAPVNCVGGDDLLYEETAAEELARHEYGGAAALYLPIAVDPSTGRIFIGIASPSVAERFVINEYTGPCTAPHTKIGGGTFGRLGSAAIGVNAITHALYVGVLGSGGGGVEIGGQIFGQATFPDVAVAPTTGVTRTSATLHGTVNPDETSVTGCEFEYGPTPGYGHSAPCSQALPLEGGTPIAVSANIGFTLPPASLVHFRLKAKNANGVTVGEDQTFYSESLPSPVVGGVAASNVGQFGATLNGTLETGEALVNYHFEYGPTTAYGSLAPIPDGVTAITAETVGVSQTVQGLRAGTTYHYRLVASSPGGTEVDGPDESFTTPSVPAPAATTGGSSEVGVGSATVSGAVDPHGWDTTYLFEYGTTTAYGSAWPTVQVDMGALEGPQPVIVTIPSLQPKTTYHYRLVATNGGGTSYGADMTFTTGEYPAQVIQEPPTLGTLLVPSEVGKVTTSQPQKAKKKKRKKGKGGPKKRHARHGARKSGRGRRLR